LQFAKAGRAATLSQQEKNYSADVQQGSFIPHGDVPGRKLRGGRAKADACLYRSDAT
jgi:hypothetical protein